MLIKTIPYNQDVVDLYDYAIRGAHDEKDFSFFHNINTGTTREAILRDFLVNEEYRPKRTQMNKYYHEIMSFHPDDGEISDTVLLDLARKYMSIRAPESVVFGKVHREKGKHTHIHFIVSGNKYHSKKSTRITRDQFRQVRIETEQYQLEKYDLHNSKVYTKERVSERVHKPKKRETQKQFLLKHAEHCAEEAISMSDFVRLMEKEKEVHVYSKGKKTFYGVHYKKNKHRLTSLLPADTISLLYELEEIHQMQQNLREKEEERDY